MNDTDNTESVGWDAESVGWNAESVGWNAESVGWDCTNLESILQPGFAKHAFGDLASKRRTAIDK